jgi:hypothetical protein
MHICTYTNTCTRSSTLHVSILLPMQQNRQNLRYGIFYLRKSGKKILSSFVLSQSLMTTATDYLGACVGR